MFLNNVTILGNLTKEPAVKTLPSGSKVANFTIATTRYYKDKNDLFMSETEFHNCVTFDKYIITALEKAAVGDKFIVTGRLKTTSWESAGVNRYKTEILAEMCKFVCAPKSRDNGVWEDVDVGRETKPNKKEEKNHYNEDDISIEDIPF